MKSALYLHRVLLLPPLLLELRFVYSPSDAPIPHTMASFEDYDEFGNYIGADLDSDDEDEIPQNQFLRDAGPSLAAPLEGYDDENMRQDEQEGAMEVDGEHNSSWTLA